MTAHEKETDKDIHDLIYWEMQNTFDIYITTTLKCAYTQKNRRMVKNNQTWDD